VKILFATMPFDGHVKPLTGIAVHLEERGHDVRWYTGPSYAGQLADLGIPHLCFERARDVNAENLARYFPEYEKLGTGPKAIAFALTHIFFGNLEAHLRDLQALHAGFPFDALVCDQGFYAGQIVAQTIQPRTYVVGPSPTPAPTSKVAPPPFFGLRPARTALGRLRDRVVGAMVESSMKPGKRILDDLLRREGLPPFTGSILDLPTSYARVFFQIGAPGMDYPRSDLPRCHRFVGALLPYRKAPRAGGFAYEQKLGRYQSLVVVSQGTVDNRDPEKLLVPTLEALRNGPHLVVATTGHRNTDALRARFPEDNLIIEDFVDFDDLLGRADLFVCNGGYGSVMQSLVRGVPILAAGKLEGKNDVNARLDFRGLGLDLRTERPTAKQIARGVARVLGDARYRENVARVKEELASYRPFEIIERALEEDGIVAPKDPRRRGMGLSGRRS
jgi:UDP:flavonoid glycosyltransferase YjiC (YdhE family)